MRLCNSPRALVTWRLALGFWASPLGIPIHAEIGIFLQLQILCSIVWITLSAFSALLVKTKLINSTVVSCKRQLTIALANRSSKKLSKLLNTIGLLPLIS